MHIWLICANRKYDVDLFHISLNRCVIQTRALRRESIDID